MAITVRTGGSAASNGAVGSIASPAFNAVAGGRIAVLITLLDNTLSVATVVDTGAGTTYSLVQAYNVSATLRLEYWRCDNPALKNGDVVTATLAAGTTPLAIAAWQWTGDVGLIIGTATATDTGYFPHISKAIDFSTDYIVAVIGWKGASTDTRTADVGTLRTSAVGAAGAAGVAIMDTTQIPVATLLNSLKLNASREWGAIALGLQATATGYPYQGGPSKGLLETRPTYELCSSPKGGGGGILPPSGDGQIFPPSF